MARKHVHDPRPYIRDAAAFDEPPSAGFVASATIGMVALALAVGFVIGFAVFLVMNLSTWLTSLLWNGATGDAPTPWFSLAVCASGGALIGAALPVPRVLLAANAERE